MSNENNGFSFGLGVCLGIIIGGFFAYIITKQSTTSATLGSLQTQQSPQISHLEKLYMQKLETRLNDEINTTKNSTIIQT